ncbi:serine-rich adhesin for platelets-like isoform X3 [Paramacrobiotus metropolitanus]|uniref:serine-rich adhesin for platelets-like isoform X3 n=1 Tax=Paramacrobiotus metropolitanus TaxID=2943436 RepID=UPI0024458D8B|nr:serine-rich adhesin for platelets-like isoform X3 [Paramacrobiotus metropolitanus]
MASFKVLLLAVMLCGLCEIVHSHGKKKNGTRNDQEEYTALFDSINEKVKFPVHGKKQQGGASSGRQSGSASDDDDDDFGSDGDMFRIFTSMSGSLVPAACQSDAECSGSGLVCSRFLGKCVAPGKSNSSASVAVSSDSAKAALRPSINGQTKDLQAPDTSASAGSDSVAADKPNAAKVSVSSSKKEKPSMGARKSMAGYSTVPLEAPSQPAAPVAPPTSNDVQPDVQPVSVKGSAAAQSASGQKRIQVAVDQPTAAAPANVSVNNATGDVSVNVPAAVGSSAQTAGLASNAGAADKAQKMSAQSADAGGDEVEGSGSDQDADAGKNVAAKPAVVPDQNSDANAQSAQSAASGPAAQASGAASSSSSSGPQNANGMKGKSKAMPLVETAPEAQPTNATATDSSSAAPPATTPENPNEIELSLMQTPSAGSALPPKVLLSSKTSIVRNKSKSKNRVSSADAAASNTKSDDANAVVPPNVARY